MARDLLLNKPKVITVPIFLLQKCSFSLSLEESNEMSTTNVYFLSSYVPPENLFGYVETV